jgi:hypothetical protein
MGGNALLVCLDQFRTTVVKSSALRDSDMFGQPMLSEQLDQNQHVSKASAHGTRGTAALSPVTSDRGSQRAHRRLPTPHRQMRGAPESMDNTRCFHLRNSAGHRQQPVQQRMSEVLEVVVEAAAVLWSHETSSAQGTWKAVMLTKNSWLVLSKWLSNICLSLKQ